MVAQKLFLGCLSILAIFNFIFFLMGSDAFLLDAGTLIGYLVTIGIIAIIISIIPLTYASSTVNWFISAMLMITVFYSWTFTIDLTVYRSPALTLGIGLCTKVMDLFSSNPNDISFIIWLFFTVIGFTGVISGILAVSSRGD